MKNYLNYTNNYYLYVTICTYHFSTSNIDDVRPEASSCGLDIMLLRF